MQVSVSDENSLIMDMVITEYQWKPVSKLYQSFQKDGINNYLAQIEFVGEQSEHEEETGSLKLYDHEFNKDIISSDIELVPFRELWMRNGYQLFQPLKQLNL